MFKTTLDFDKLNIYEGHITIRPLIQNLCLIAKYTYACSSIGRPPPNLLTVLLVTGKFWSKKWCLRSLFMLRSYARSSANDRYWIKTSKWILFKAQDSLIHHLPHLTWLVIFCNLEKDVFTVMSKLQIFLHVGSCLRIPIHSNMSNWDTVLFNNTLSWFWAQLLDFLFFYIIDLGPIIFFSPSLPSFMCKMELIIVSPW